MTDRASMRIAYGKALAAYGAENPDVVVLDADVSKSTQTHYFAKRFPERFFNLGVAEAGMLDAAVGFALGGKIPFVNTFAFLLSLRCAEQVRTCVAYARTNVKLIGAYAGLSDAFDGPTHHAIVDVAVLRCMPNVTVLVAADALEAAKLVPVVAEYDGPVYLRVSRAEVPSVFDGNYQPRIGQGSLLRAGDDVTVIACGVMVARALEAAERLSKQGINARVLAMASLKPLDREMILASAADTGAIVTAEEHSVIGGLGSAVAELLAGERPVPVMRVGIPDTFTETGPYEALLDRYGMSVEDIVSAAVRAVQIRS